MPRHPTPPPTPVHSRHGAHLTADGQTRFGLWAPQVDRVDIDLDGRSRAMQPAGDGWWQLLAEAPHGTPYAYRLDGGQPLPDPAARWLPEGVHGPAAVLDVSRLDRGARGFQAPPVTGAVIYELHTGTFTPEGTFDAAVPHLAALVEFGVTHVEVMPVNAFDGRHGWGYDGVAWWAVHQPYGGPERFAAFVAACHDAGLAVVLDVVHNHLGPSGNYLSHFGPYLQSDAKSAWGQVINLDREDAGPVRELIIGNALAWLRDFEVDALRLDAVHALDDRGSATHLLAEMADAVAALAEQTGRRLELIAETDRNDPQTIRPRGAGGLGLDAQWADDLHHAIHVAVTDEKDGYYADYDQSLTALAHAYTHGFVYDGRHRTFRGRVVGAPVPADVSLRRLVSCVQNHDQVGNRPAGDRLTTQVDADLVRVAIALLCLAPHTPMLFMGEEYGETAPFQFFSDMSDEDLRRAIREGRRNEFAYFTSWGGEVPDPLDPETFARSTLDRRLAETPAGRQRRTLWTDLLRLRRTQPALGTGDARLISADADEAAQVLTVIRRAPTSTPLAPGLRITANLSPEPVEVADVAASVLSTADTAYGGAGLSGDGTVAARTVAVHALPLDAPAPPGA